MLRILPLLLMGSFVCFASCAPLAAVRKDRLYAYLTDNSKYILLSPGEIEKPMDMAQHLSAYYNGRDYFFNAWVKADETGTEITLFNELGANMGELVHRDGAINFSSPIFPGSLRSEYIVADFQLCFYNPVSLRKALEDCGLVLETQGSTRRILNRNSKEKDLVIEIEKAKNSVRFINHLRGYVYTLEGDFE